MSELSNVHNVIKMDTKRENDRETEYTLRCLNMPSSTSVTKTSFTEEIVGGSRMKRSIDVRKERSFTRFQSCSATFLYCPARSASCSLLVYKTSYTTANHHHEYTKDGKFSSLLCHSRTTFAQHCVCV